MPTKKITFAFLLLLSVFLYGTRSVEAAKVVVYDSCEHGQFPKAGVWLNGAPTGSNRLDQIRHLGRRAYRLPKNGVVGNNTGSKLWLHRYNELKWMRTDVHPNPLVQFWAYFYIERGFTDTRWKSQFQWKVAYPGPQTGNNPKIRVGFQNIGGKLQTVLAVVSPTHGAGHSHPVLFTQPAGNVKVVAKNQWLKLDVRVNVSKNGFIHVYHNGKRVFNLSCNTLTQKFHSGTWSTNKGLQFAVNNYGDPRSDFNILWVDDIMYKDLRR